MFRTVGALDFVVLTAYYIILAFLLRIASAKWSDRPIGKAIAALHG